MSDIVEIMARAMERLDPPWRDIENARAVLTALEEKGYVVAPKVPTEAMIESGRAATAAFLDIQGSGVTIAREKMRRRYAAMIAASQPSPIAKSLPSPLEE